MIHQQFPLQLISSIFAQQPQHWNRKPIVQALDLPKILRELLKVVIFEQPYCVFLSFILLWTHLLTYICNIPERLPDCVYRVSAGIIFIQGTYDMSIMVRKQKIDDLLGTAQCHFCLLPPKKGTSMLHYQTATSSSYILRLETTGCWSGGVKEFVREIVVRLRERGCDPRSGDFLAQRSTSVIQRENRKCRQFHEQGPQKQEYTGRALIL